MHKQKLMRAKSIALLLSFFVEIQKCKSVTTYSTASTHILKINESTTFTTHKNHSKTNNITNAFEKNSTKDGQDYILCEILSRNLTWENASCKESLVGNDVICLPRNHGCVNMDDNVYPCNMTCRHEFQLMYAQCPILSEESKESIKLAKFLLDGVLKVKYH